MVGFAVDSGFSDGPVTDGGTDGGTDDGADDCAGDAAVAGASPFAGACCAQTPPSPSAIAETTEGVPNDACRTSRARQDLDYVGRVYPKRGVKPLAVAEGVRVEIGRRRASGIIGNQHHALPSQLEPLAATQIPAGYHFHPHAPHHGARVGENALRSSSPTPRGNSFFLPLNHPPHRVGATPAFPVRAHQRQVLRVLLLNVKLPSSSTVCPPLQGCRYHCSQQ